MSDADDATNPLIIAIQNGAGTPPKSTASHISVTSSMSEFFILFGSGRQVVAADLSGPLPNLLIEWFQSVAVNPIVAKQLVNVMHKLVQNYEQTYGTIPEDPNAKFILSTPVTQYKPVQH